MSRQFSEKLDECHSVKNKEEGQAGRTPPTDSIGAAGIDSGMAVTLVDTPLPAGSKEAEVAAASMEASREGTGPPKDNIECSSDSNMVQRQCMVNHGSFAV